VGQQVILPGHKRKGNLLSSIFLLFTGLSEWIIGFCEAIARIPIGLDNNFTGREGLLKAWAYSRTHLRRGMLILTWALFILSSLEWAPPQHTINEPAAIEQRVEQGERIACRATAGMDVHETALPSTQWQGTILSPDPDVGGSRWLLLCMLRI
jgi:hypothetical protein